MKNTLLVLGLVLGVHHLQAQFADSAYKSTTPPPAENSKKFDPSRLVFGGNLGANFGDFTFVNISPQVGYMFSPVITAGAGINYIYNSIKTRDLSGNLVYKENLSYAGINLFGRVFPTNFLFATLQPEINYSWGKINFENSNQPDIKIDGAWVPTLLAGAGVIVGGGGGRGGLMLSVQYDLIQDSRSPYGNRPFIGIGYAF